MFDLLRTTEENPTQMNTPRQQGRFCELSVDSYQMPFIHSYSQPALVGCVLLLDRWRTGEETPSLLPLEEDDQAHDFVVAG